MQKRKINTYLLFVFILFILILYFSLKDDYKSIILALSKANVFYIIIAIGFVIISKYFIGLITYLLAKEEKKRVSFKKMLHISLIYPFFAGITPGALGGEAFEIFYLKSTGINYGKASNIVMEKYIIYEITLIIVNLLAVILNTIFRVVKNNPLIISVLVISFIYNTFMLGASYLIVYNKKIKNFVLTKGIKLLSKIKIIKDKKETKNKINNFIDNFNNSAESLRQNKILFIKLVCYNVISLIFILIAAYPVLLSFHSKYIDIISIFIIFTYLKMMVMFIATPGNSGISEYTFIYLLTGLLKDDILMAFMLLWRFVTYYIPLILGGVLALTWKGKIKNEEIDSI